MNFLDTADVYGRGANEELVGRALQGRRDQAVLATKFGNVRASDGRWLGVNGRPEYVAQSCKASLRRLGVTHIDLYCQHRVDPDVPIEETVGAMAKLCSKARCATSVSRKRARRPSAAPRLCTRSPLCKANIRCGLAIPKLKFWLPAANLVSDWLLIARWAADFLPGDSGF